MSRQIILKSFLADQWEDYLNYRSRIGFTSQIPPWFFATLDRYIVKNKVNAGDMTPSFFLEFRKSIDAEPGTVNKIFIHLKGFFDYLVRNEKLSSNPVVNIPKMPENAYIPYVFSPQQIDELLRSISNSIRHDREFNFLKDLACISKKPSSIKIV